MHFRILGFWRVAAAVLVMMFHFLNYGPESATEMTERLRALAPLLDMFMMISGFLIMFRYVDRLLVEPAATRASSGGGWRVSTRFIFSPSSISSWSASPSIWA